MADTFSLVAKIINTDYAVPLGFEIWLDDQCLLDQEHVSQPIDFAREISDVQGKHNLRFVLKNKLPQHTTIDADGNILKDACIQLESVKIDDLDVTDIVCLESKYTHDFNKSGDLAQHVFWGVMGCNGIASMDFTTPIYIWVIEKI